MSNLTDRTQGLKKQIDDSGFSYEAIAHATRGYSAEYILRILRRGIKNPGMRSVNAIEESFNELQKAKNGLPERNSRAPMLSRETAIAILEYQESDKWEKDVHRWKAQGVSCFEAKLLAMLMHMNQSIL